MDMNCVCLLYNRYCTCVGHPSLHGSMHVHSEHGGNIELPLIYRSHKGSKRRGKRKKAETGADLRCHVLIHT